MHAASRRSSLNLCALFATLLSGCASRPIDSDSDSDGESSTSDTSGESSTTDTTTDATTTVATTVATTDLPPECNGSSHEIKLTPEEWEHWKEHGTPPEGAETGGEGTGGDTTGGDTTGVGTTGVDSDATSDAMQTTAETSAGGSTGGDELSPELCKEICAHVTGVWIEDVGYCVQQGVDELGGLLIYCETGLICEGRRHACIESRGAEIGDDPVGAWFARAAHDEAASVYAFLELERELAEYGAPAELLARIRDAAEDEVRHARSAAALARRHGGEPQHPRRSTPPARSLLEIARENAVEGCVRETWAALSAAHQARWAADRQIRAEMAVIAADEARHAELAWAIDAWLRAVLSDGEWAEVEAARRAAADELTASLAVCERDAALVRRAGVPDRKAAGALSAGLADALWSAAA